MTSRPPSAQRTKARRRPITFAQIAEIAARMGTATSLREIAKELDLDKQTVFKVARPVIETMRAAGTLGHCQCGRERFHPRGCARILTNRTARWDTPQQREKRAAIIGQIMRGDTFESIADRWGFGRWGAMNYLRWLTPEQRAERKAKEQARSYRTAGQETLQAYRDPTYVRIAAAVPRWLSNATRDDAISDLYVAVLDGTVSLENIDADAKAYASRAVEQYESKFGPRSLDEKMFDDGDTTLGDMIIDPSALAAFDHIFEEAR